MMHNLFSLFKTQLLALWLFEYDTVFSKPRFGTEFMCNNYNFLNSFADVYVSTQFMS